MKPAIQGWYPSPATWQSAVSVQFNEQLELRINNILQQGVFHYTEDNFLTDNLLKKIEVSCGI